MNKFPASTAWHPVHNGAEIQNEIHTVADLRFNS